LASRANKVALIIWIFKVLSKLWSSTVSYIVFYLILNLLLSTKSILYFNLGFLSILFIVEY